MAIDAVIEDVGKEGQNLRLYLRPRVDDWLRESIAGQSEILILGCTHTPQRGQQVWGGSGQFCIEPQFDEDRRWWYVRQGATQAIEQYHEAADQTDKRTPAGEIV